jgi:hypothetical protein
MTMKKKLHMQDAFYQAIGAAYQLNPRKQEKVDSRDDLKKSQTSISQIYLKKLSIISLMLIDLLKS